MQNKEICKQCVQKKNLKANILINHIFIFGLKIINLQKMLDFLCLFQLKKCLSIKLSTAFVDKLKSYRLINDLSHFGRFE